jgi:AI-2 transport protein TqsA
MALIFFGMIWGPVGAFLAAPVTAVIKIVLEKAPATRPIARVLAGDLGPLSRASPGSEAPGSCDSTRGFTPPPTRG